MNSPEPVPYTDLHSHLVPGVDDGARTQEEGLEAIQRLWEEGFRTVVTTPHLEGSLTKMPEALHERLREVDLAWEGLKREASRVHPEMEFHRGHEVMLDVPDPDFSDPRTRLAGTSTVLVEWPRLQVPPGTPEVLGRIREAGYTVVLAHPERYQGLNAGLDLPGEWRRMGALLQVNYGSLVGRYGEEPRRRALIFLERGWVDLFSTDFHARSHLPINVRRAREVMELLDGSEQFELLARTNPQRVLKGDEPLPAHPLAQKRGVWDKLREMFSVKERR